MQEVDVDDDDDDDDDDDSMDNETTEGDDQVKLIFENKFYMQFALMFFFTVSVTNTYMLKNDFICTSICYMYLLCVDMLLI